MNLEQLKELYRNNRCSRLLFKILAANDNSKNQIYAGSDFTAVSILPCGSIKQHRVNTSGHTKRSAKEIFKADLDFDWLDENGNAWPAPDAQMILYPQYPEIRLSGFLKGCEKSPSEVICERREGRILFLGISENNKIKGFVVRSDSEIANEIAEQTELEQRGVFFELPLGDYRRNSKEILISKLREIYLKGWISGKRLTRDGDAIAYKAPNAGGYTLEAELGVLPQGFSQPDYLGWEIKQHRVSSFERIETGAITLMTPEPDAGFYKEKGAIEFVLKYGYRDKNSREDRLNFGGTHYINKPNATTGLALTLDGYDPGKNIISSPNGGICLTDGENILAKWSFAVLIDHWKRKHSQAAYIPALYKKEEDVQMFWYGPIVRLGEGTDILMLLKAISSCAVYYDPGIKLENVSIKPKIKRRSQFRIHSRNIPVLYKEMETKDIR
jgi:hypothetical protein